MPTVEELKLKLEDLNAYRRHLVRQLEKGTLKGQELFNVQDTILKIDVARVQITHAMCWLEEPIKY